MISLELIKRKCFDNGLKKLFNKKPLKFMERQNINYFHHDLDPLFYHTFMNVWKNKLFCSSYKTFNIIWSNTVIAMGIKCQDIGFEEFL